MNALQEVDQANIPYTPAGKTPPRVTLPLNTIAAPAAAVQAPFVRMPTPPGISVERVGLLRRVERSETFDEVLRMLNAPR